MGTKLTLKLKKNVIEKAKKYASDKKLSLSQIIEFYLQSLTSDNTMDEFEISPFIKSIATGKSISENTNHKTEYLEHLVKKYN